jgi:hypothetical protein
MILLSTPLFSHWSIPLREAYQMILLSTPLFSHWSIPLRRLFEIKVSPVSTLADIKVRTLSTSLSDVVQY